jgi:hypothetical protein
MNGRQKERGNSSPYATGVQSSSRGKAKQPSTLHSVSTGQFYAAGPVAPAASRRKKSTALPSPSDKPINLARTDSMAEQEFIEVDLASEEEIESPEIAHVPPIASIAKTPTGPNRNQVNNSTGTSKMSSVKASISERQDTAAALSVAKKKVMQGRPVPSKVGLLPPLIY